MSQNLDHKKLQTQIDSVKTVHLEAGDLTIANQISKTIEIKDDLPNLEKRRLLHVIESYFPNLKTDSKKQVESKINLLEKIISEKINDSISESELVDLILSYNEMAAQFLYGKVSKKHSITLTRIRKNLESKQNIFPKVIETDYISNAKEENSIKLVREIKLEINELENILALKPSKYDNIPIFEPLIGSIFNVRFFNQTKQNGSHNCSKVLKENHPDLMEKYSELYIKIRDMSENPKYDPILHKEQLMRIISKSKLGYFKYQANSKTSIYDEILLICDILNENQSLILPIRNRLVKALKIYTDFADRIKQ